jgi:hypothetical protein
VNQRILELALEALTARKAELDAEIEALKNGLPSRPSARPPVARAPKRAHPMKSPAARKAQSAKMKTYWAKRKAEEVKASGRKRKKG